MGLRNCNDVPSQGEDEMLERPKFPLDRARREVYYMNIYS
jgi:hypothetical protein